MPHSSSHWQSQWRLELNKDSFRILFNHEGRRRVEFVKRKIRSGVVRIEMGLASEIRLGNLDGRLDWRHSAYYVLAK
jgi:GDP-D-mannose dehydratase